MVAKGLGQYYYRSTTAFSTAGNYSYTIWAMDTSSNVISSSNVLFSMPANWDMDNDGTCGILDLVVISDQYGKSGVSGWIREDVDNTGIITVLDLVYVSDHLAESWLVYCFKFLFFLIIL
ncbi:Uncharacterised protein [uncultured archaeon]|nr:Uncharacterised protein [uncultured archaeon]